MSYILDALKKADTERVRSAVPGLHAQADGFGVADRRGLPWGWIGLGVVVLLAALLAWWWLGRDEPAPAAAPVAAATAPAPSPTPMPVPAPAPAPAPAPIAATPPAPVAPAPAPTTQAPIAHMPPPPSADAKPAPPTAVAALPKAAAALPASASDARIPTRNELPTELRAALPPLNVSGAVYAPQPAGRMLFVNGLVLREGDAVADGLTVERIGASASVLVFRGQRFELKH